MTPIILLSPNGKVLYCPEWPEKFLYIVDGHLSPQYKTDCEQAIANGIEFKDQGEIKQLLWMNQGFNKGENGYIPLRLWQMEPLKPYDIPEGIVIEIREILNSPDQNKSLLDRNDFAFIKPLPKVESQDGLWRQAAELFEKYEQEFAIEELKSKFRIERIKK